MMAQGEILGVLHLQDYAAAAAPAPASGKQEETQVVALARSVGEHIALAIANLRLREILRAQSIRDPLTNLFNRRYLEETLGRELRRAIRKHGPLGIIFIDIDQFKSFNDTYGHDVGDAILKELGAFLTTCVRDVDIVCRYGGDEFVIVLPDTSLAIARQRAEEIRTGVASVTISHIKQTPQSITLSLGVSAFPEFEATPDTLLRAADVALRQAKSKGRNSVVAAKSRRRQA